jgi:hypothetical protein
VARKVVKLAIFLLFVHAAYRFIPIYLHYQQFKDGVHETARFSKGKTDPEIVDRVMELAEKYHVPLQRDYVHVRREGEQLFISASYVELVEWLPRYRRPQQFDVGEAVFTNVRPVNPSDVGR